jgi:hypothetical protein
VGRLPRPAAAQARGDSCPALKTCDDPDYMHGRADARAVFCSAVHSAATGGAANGESAPAADEAEEPAPERKMTAAEAVIEKHKERAKRARCPCSPSSCICCRTKT